MPWTPQEPVLNCRAIADNLLAYFKANQSDALKWANGGAAMKPFKAIADAIADPNKPLFPALQFSDDNDAVNYTETYPSGAYQVMFEAMVQNSVPGKAVSEARTYARAVASMIRNCPKETLTAGTGAQARATVLNTLEIGFDPIKTNDQQNDFLQVFQIRATFELYA